MIQKSAMWVRMASLLYRAKWEKAQNKSVLQLNWLPLNCRVLTYI